MFFEIARSLYMKTKQIFKLLVKLEGVGGQRQTHRGLDQFPSPKQHADPGTSVAVED